MLKILVNETTEDTEQKMKRLEKLLEDEIFEIAKYIKIKLSFGIDIFNIQMPDTTIELKIISYPEFLDIIKNKPKFKERRNVSG